MYIYIYYYIYTYRYITIWHHLAPFGTIWHHLAPFGTIWHHLAQAKLRKRWNELTHQPKPTFTTSDGNNAQKCDMGTSRRVSSKLSLNGCPKGSVATAFIESAPVRRRGSCLCQKPNTICCPGGKAVATGGTCQDTQDTCDGVINDRSSQSERPRYTAVSGWL